MEERLGVDARKAAAAMVVDGGWVEKGKDEEGGVVPEVEAASAKVVEGLAAWEVCSSDHTKGRICTHTSCSGPS